MSEYSISSPGQELTVEYLPSGVVYAATADLPALRHRIQLHAEAEMEGVTTESVINGVLRTVPVPR